MMMNGYIKTRQFIWSNDNDETYTLINIVCNVQ